jgi:hypothetical protein
MPWISALIHDHFAGENHDHFGGKWAKIHDHFAGHTVSYSSVSINR